MSAGTIAKPELAPLGREPMLVDVDWIEFDHGVLKNQRYRVEVWRLATGRSVAIVSDNGGTSLMNASEKIATAIRSKWGFVSDPNLTIIEDWGSDGGFLRGERFMVSDETGANSPVDRQEWLAQGLVLPQ